MLNINNKPDNKIESCDDKNCLTCSLVEEFSALIKEDIHWENALRYVLEVALLEGDENIDSLVKEVFSDGFSEGVLFGIQQSQERLQDFYNDVSETIENEEVLNDDVENTGVTDDIQEIIRKNQGKSL